MPNEKVADSSRPRPRVVCAPSPTMMDDRIGTMGSTHGVKDRPSPSSANSGRITSSLPDLRAASSLPASLPAAPAVAGAVSGASTVVTGSGMARMVTPGGTGASLPSRPALAATEASAPAPLSPAVAPLLAGALVPATALAAAAGVAAGAAAAAGSVDRHGHGDGLAIGFYIFLESLIEMHGAGRYRQRAHFGPHGTELEALAVHIIAIGDLEGDRYRMAVQSSRREFERHIRFEETIIGTGRHRAKNSDQREQRKAKTDKTQHGLLSTKRLSRIVHRLSPDRLIAPLKLGKGQHSVRN